MIELNIRRKVAGWPGSKRIVYRLSFAERFAEEDREARNIEMFSWAVERAVLRFRPEPVEQEPELIQ